MPHIVQLGRYQLLYQIAFGGMAEIYRARTFTEDGQVQYVAIKRVLPHLAEDEQFLQMLADEARIAGLLRHEAIAQLYEFSRVGNEYFMAMEFVDGKDVRSILEKCRRERRWLPPELAAFIIMRALEGLHAAHEVRDESGKPLNLVHRDVSPSNILVGYDGSVKLCDFGIAKATLSRVKTRAGIIKGKVKYMSPEQAMGRRLDRRSDIFSAGSVLYEMLTMVPPFLAKNEIQLILKVRDAKFVPVRERNPAVPPALEFIVHRAMSRSRTARFQTAREFAQALRDFLGGHARGLNARHLSRYMKSLFARELDREQELLREAEMAVPQGPVGELGENLIADALGPEAAYSGFLPVPPEAALPAGGQESPEPRPRSFEELPRASEYGAEQSAGEMQGVALNPLGDPTQQGEGEIAVPREAVDHDAETILLELSNEQLETLAAELAEAEHGRGGRTVPEQGPPRDDLADRDTIILTIDGSVLLVDDDGTSDRLPVAEPEPGREAASVTDRAPWPGAEEVGPQPTGSLQAPVPPNEAETETQLDEAGTQDLPPPPEDLPPPPQDLPPPPDTQPESRSPSPLPQEPLPPPPQDLPPPPQDLPPPPETQPESRSPSPLPEDPLPPPPQDLPPPPDTQPESHSPSPLPEDPLPPPPQDLPPPPQDLPPPPQDLPPLPQDLPPPPQDLPPPPQDMAGPSQDVSPTPDTKAGA